MADQMTPAEMRETSKRLRARVSVMERLGETADDERAGADALDRLADVIEYLEGERTREGARWAGRRTFARDVLNRVYGWFHTGVRDVS